MYFAQTALTAACVIIFVKGEAKNIARQEISEESESEEYTRNNANGNHTFIALIDILFVDNSKRTCTGAIVHDNVVITAAHCFFGQDRLSESKPELTASFVVIGTKHMFDTGYEQYLPIERIVVHPKYEGWTADLALVFTFAAMTSDKPGSVIPLASEKTSAHLESNVTLFSWGHPRQRQLASSSENPPDFNKSKTIGIADEPCDLEENFNIARKGFKHTTHRNTIAMVGKRFRNSPRNEPSTNDFTKKTTKKKTSYKDTSKENNSDKQASKGNKSYKHTSKQNNSDKHRIKENMSYRHAAKENKSHKRTSKENKSYEDISEENKSYKQTLRENKSYKHILKEFKPNKHTSEEYKSDKQISQENKSYKQTSQEDKSYKQPSPKRKKERVPRLLYSFKANNNWRRSMGSQQNRLIVENFNFVNIQSCRALVEKALPEKYNISKHNNDVICYTNSERCVDDSDSGAPVVRQGMLVAITVGGAECEGDHVAVGMKMSCFCSWISDNLPTGSTPLVCCKDCCNVKHKEEKKKERRHRFRNKNI